MASIGPPDYIQQYAQTIITLRKAFAIINGVTDSNALRVVFST